MSDTQAKSSAAVKSQTNNGEIDLSGFGFEVLDAQSREYRLVYYSIRRLLERDAAVDHAKKNQETGVLFDKEAFRATFTKQFDEVEQQKYSLEQLLKLAKQKWGMALVDLKAFNHQNREEYRRYQERMNGY